MDDEVRSLAGAGSVVVCEPGGTLVIGVRGKMTAETQAALARFVEARSAGGVSVAVVPNVVAMAVVSGPAATPPPSAGETSPLADATAVLVAHQRMESRACLCGWAELGRMHAKHQAAELAAAGLLAGGPAGR